MNENGNGNMVNIALKIALFGTSADPPTIGHQQILLWLAQRFDQVVVWAADNPFKTHQAPLDQRVAMLQVLIEEVQGSCHGTLGVYPELAHRRTIHTVEQARKRWPEATFTLVVGSDLLPQLRRWHRATELLSQVKVLVMPRPGSVLDKEQVEQLRQGSLEVTIGDLAGLPVSSTAYRELNLPQVVTPGVQAYICQHNLYPSHDRCQTSFPQNDLPCPSPTLSTSQT